MPSASKAPSQRMLQVGEEVRHALSEIFLRGECHAMELEGISITVSQVRMSPDLKQATAYIATLYSFDVEALLPVLNKHHEKTIRKLLASRLKLKYLPSLHFRADYSFDEAQKIHRLLAATGDTDQDPD